ncbi:HAD family hydrolase [Photobacterium carnosum]|jgi:HAD superfamily hydrolase (TIGR01509 family)|uniref:HAD family hydrolase n=1 Tax=Photobacterium carnosum TaxID=2023717 RepID=UPI001E5D8210|nr:HAD family phosphatase [Photobacterium carnosum]MCD9495427.1 HAD-IA family hydrolase [Photobacterium carnosum]MCD9498381.1 HAD-IA family hydrolase [Photobacterium carnosum]MCD9514383.1 HAD-IA family hydrolase [Photobacterium carnosum]MCD9523519.1 HAD-IA family hydrolase [Photobacterium carnosum]MCD9531425.1 HAD-IA family hydrolase [Photobacterium carnosum]
MQTLFFDFDGTLVDSETFHANNWSDYLATYGVTLTAEDFIEYYAGVTWPKIAKHFIDSYQLNVDIVTITTEMEALTDTKIRQQGIPALPGVDAVLHAFSGKVPMAVVTGAPRDYVEGVLKLHGWLDLFDQVFSGYEVANNKPSPDVYLHACQAMKVQPYQVVAIEDSRTGLQSAKNADICCLLINGHSSLTAINADHSFVSMVEAKPLLDALFKDKLSSAAV